MSGDDPELSADLSVKLKQLQLMNVYRPSSPSKTACHGEKFDKTLSAKDTANLRKAQTHFNNYKKHEKTQTVFDAIYDGAENCFELALKFHVQGLNYQDCKAKSFTYYVLEAFREYIRKRPEKYAALDDCTKLTAFHLTNKDSNGTLFRIVAEAYKFPESCHLFDDYVQDLIAQHNYMRAAQVAQHTGLVHEDFIFGFLIPISFSRHDAGILYDYLIVGKVLKYPLLKALDSMIVDRVQTGNLLSHMMLKYKYKDLPPENLTYEYLRKNIPKLRKRLEVPMDITPNSARLELISAAVFKMIVLIQKFMKGDINPAFFEKEIRILVSRENQELQLILLQKLLSFNLDLECLKWVLHFDMNVQRLPSYIQNRIDLVVKDQMSRMERERGMGQDSQGVMMGQGERPGPSYSHYNN